MMCRCKSNLDLGSEDGAAFSLLSVLRSACCHLFVLLINPAYLCSRGPIGAGHLDTTACVLLEKLCLILPALWRTIATKSINLRATRLIG